MNETPRREIAEAFVAKWAIYASPVDAVELLLKARDERAAKIANKRAKELQRMTTATLLDDATVAQFRRQSAVCNELAAVIRGKD